MSDNNPILCTFPHLPVILRRLRAAGVEDDLREIFRVTLAHVGNEADEAHAFLNAAGVVEESVPGRRRVLTLNYAAPMTFGRTHEGEQCDESDLEP